MYIKIGEIRKEVQGLKSYGPNYSEGKYYLVLDFESEHFSLEMSKEKLDDYLDRLDNWFMVLEINNE